ncbi:brassinosteroid-responsive RING protein 1-like [Andrographis paniculata]|uniref:brassinosteroid-responsive RING protein 1-like n=1 Tax=Andrographis paniculata TaxID=175694 RepID=UPI0021E75F6D|nr:brassinosteroid-responsive RING protein 1-like [Andrographis paniculata]
MGFPVGYSDLLLPKTVVIFLTVLGFLRKIACSMASLVEFWGFREPGAAASYQLPTESGRSEPPRSLSAVLIRELLPVVRLRDLAERVEAPENCAVCLYEFDGGGDDEIRWLANCRHVFHRKCLDRWIDHDQKTCPLCRAQFVPEDMQEAFYERLWAASGISDLYGDYSLIAAGGL